MPDDGFARVGDPRRIYDAAARLSQAGYDHAVPLVVAAGEGILDLHCVPPGGRVPLRILDPVRQHRPVLILLGGDGDAPAGPDGFPQAARLLRWSRWTVIHGTGGTRAHYATAAEAARRFGRVLLVECGSSTLDAWLSLRETITPNAPGLILKPLPGHVHPLPGAPPGVVVQ